MTTQFSFGNEPVTCHAWNADRTKIALSQNDNQVKIFKMSGREWVLEEVLTEHVQQVMDIDWAPKRNSLLTCGADRNAYVWTQQADGKWKPTLVILRIDRAAVCCKWSPNENKFAVGSGSKVVCICYFEKDHDWWVSKHIKKSMKSTAKSLDWHPNNILLACGSSDFKARVFSTYVKDVEEKPSDSVWGNKMNFGSLLADFSNTGGGWVHSVAFSGSGDQLAWVGHDSSLSVVDAKNGMKMATVKAAFLPFLTVTWLNLTTLVAAGHDCCPILFTYVNGQLKCVGKAETGTQKATGSAFSAKQIFQNMAARNTTANEISLETLHQNSICSLSVHTGSKSNCIKFATGGIDGQLIVWETKSLESAMKGLSI
jgi:actin related protein 2/3 complex subunit 1A/1B